MDKIRVVIENIDWQKYLDLNQNQAYARECPAIPNQIQT